MWNKQNGGEKYKKFEKKIKKIGHKTNQVYVYSVLKNW